MTPLHGVWISSCVGAVLFWLAGYLIASRRAVAGAAGGAELQRARGDLKAALDREMKLVAELSFARGGQNAAQADHRHASEELSALKGELESVRRGGAGAGEDLAELRTELEAARHAREVAALEARDARAAVERALAAAQQRIGELEERIANSEAADTGVRADPGVLAAVELELERTRAEAATRATEAKRLRASFDQLQAEKKELLARLAPSASPAAIRPTTRNDLASLQAEVERLKVAVLHARSERDAATTRAREFEGEAQRLRKGGSTTLIGLTDPVAEAERAKHELRLARNELARLQQAFASAKLSSSARRPEAAPPAPTPLPPGALGGVLRSLLEAASRNGRTRGVVVADESGLVIVSSGSETEALAAAAAVFVDSATRVLRSVLPLGSVRNLSVVDEHEVTIAALPLAVGDHPLILATLSDGPGPDPEALHKIVAGA